MGNSVDAGGSFAIVGKVCPLCGTEESHKIPADGFMDWKSGMLIQRALPDGAFMDECIREFLMTGMCKRCRDETDDMTFRAEQEDLSAFCDVDAIVGVCREDNPADVDEAYGAGTYARLFPSTDDDGTDETEPEPEQDPSVGHYARNAGRLQL